MVHVAREDAFEHLMQPVHVGIVHVARAAARLEQEQRVGVERRDLEIVGILRRHLLHRLGVGAVLLDALGRVELLDVADRHRVDERALLRRGPALRATAPSASRRTRAAIPRRVIGAFRYEPHAHASPQ